MNLEVGMRNAEVETRKSELGMRKSEVRPVWNGFQPIINFRHFSAF